LNINIKIISTAASILSKEALLVCLIYRSLELDLLIPEFTTNVNVGSFSSHTETNNKSTFHKLMRVVSENFSVFAGTWLRLITVDDEVRRSAIRYLGHE
jgi:hypothetical protein